MSHEFLFNKKTYLNPFSKKYFMQLVQFNLES